MATSFSKERIRRFAVAYMRTGNQAMAYRATLPDPERPNQMTARTEGHVIFNLPETQAELAKLRERAAEKAATSLSEWLANELRIARFDMSRLFDEDGHLMPLSEIDPDTRAAIQQIDVEEEQVEIKRSGDVEIVRRTRVKKVKVHSKDGAQDRLAKHLGAYSKDNDQKRMPYEDALRMLHGLTDAG